MPAPLNYKGFPKATCISVNHVVCHGIPSEKTLHDGDILNIDITVILDGWYGDTSRMFWVGEPSVKAKRLTEVTYEAMMRAINVVKPGTTLGDIGHAIQEYAEAARFRLSAISPATVLDVSFTLPRRSCIMVIPEQA